MAADADHPDGFKGVPADAVDISGDGGVFKRVLVAGDPAEGNPADKNVVQVHYVGTLLSDGSKFDSSRDRSGNFSFNIGKSEVIKAWDLGVATMHKGEKAELFCRSDYAYGDRGAPPKIPGGAALKFEVELLSWAEKKLEKHELRSEEKLAYTSKCKVEATALFKKGDYAAARAKYDDAADMVTSHYDFREEPEKADALDLRVSCLLNTAMCSIKLGEWHEVEAPCCKVLAEEELPQASRVKALFRRGSARIRMSDFSGAQADLLEACKLDPKSREIREAYASIKEAKEAAKKADAGLFAKMVKGAGGVKKKPPEGVPADAADISDDGGLCKRVLVAGDPAEGTPPKGAKVQVHYVGTLLSDGSKFDSSRDRLGNFSFTIGQGQVIKGWDTGVATMHKGEKAELFCRSDYAYGDSGSPPKIPGGATLKFEVELLSWAMPGGDADDDDDDDVSDDEDEDEDDNGAGVGPPSPQK